MSSCLSLCVPSTKLRVGWSDFVTLYQNERYGGTVVQRNVRYGRVFNTLHNYSQFLEPPPHGGGLGAVAQVSLFINAPLVTVVQSLTKGVVMFG